MSVLHVLFENEDWMPPLRTALSARGVTWEEHRVTGGHIDLSVPPPEGIFLNRMSPSAHTRGHQGGVRFLQQYLTYLEHHGRRVINGSQAFALEVSKVAQDLALRRAGIRSPRTVAVVGGPEPLKAAARNFPLPFITKDNQGGKGLGVKLFRDLAAFDAYVDGPDFIEGPDGVTLLQQYVTPAEAFITRIEIVDGVFQYALRSSTEDGFELCPADACAIDDEFCPVGDTGKFSLRSEITADDPLVQSYIELMRNNGLDLAGIEFVEDANRVRYTYDINGTTNYNGDVEAQHGLSGMGALAALIERELRSVDLAA
ncbi:MAG: alpha-L-glutamate ligase [Myxococcota bacterium]